MAVGSSKVERPNTLFTTISLDMSNSTVISIQGECATSHPVWGQLKQSQVNCCVCPHWPLPTKWISSYPVLTGRSAAARGSAAFVSNETALQWIWTPTRELGSCANTLKTQQFLTKGPDSEQIKRSNRRWHLMTNLQHHPTDVFFNDLTLWCTVTKAKSCYFTPLIALLVIYNYVCPAFALLCCSTVILSIQVLHCLSKHLHFSGALQIP